MHSRYPNYGIGKERSGKEMIGKERSGKAIWDL
jgi:hypothetical protein